MGPNSKLCGAKNRVIVIQKEKRQSSLASFWITMILFFAPCFFAPYFVPDFFQGYKPTHISKTRIVGADWLGVLKGCLLWRKYFLQRSIWKHNILVSTKHYHQFRKCFFSLKFWNRTIRILLFFSAFRKSVQGT